MDFYKTFSFSETSKSHFWKSLTYFDDISRKMFGYFYSNMFHLSDPFLKLAGSEPNLCCDVLPCYRIIGGIYNFCPQTCKMHNIIEIIFLTLRVLVES